MHLLIGLPLTLFRLLAGFVMLILRLIVPAAVIVVIFLLIRRGRRRNDPPPREERPREPHFDGPVYTVDYQDVPEDDRGGGKE